MSNRTLFRSGVSRGILGVSKTKEIIKGFSVIQTGEALGHGFEIDETTLLNVIEKGNKLQNGLKSRFGHPNMSNEALGTFLGRAHDFRLSDEGDRVLADLHISKTAHETPNGDLAKYVISLALEDPEAFGTSIVFEVEIEEQLDNNGKQLTDQDGNDLLPLARVRTLFAVDAVDEPAANEKGFLGHGFFGPDVKLSAEATGFLDKFIEMPDCMAKARAFLDRYELNRTTEIEKTLATSQTGTNEFVWTEDLKTNDQPKNMILTREAVEMTQKEFCTKYPEAVKEIEDSAFEEGLKLGAETERGRIKGVQEQGESLAGHSDLIESLKFDGKTTPEMAAIKMLAAEKVKMTSLSKSISEDANINIPAQAPTNTEPVSNLSVEEKCEKEWKEKLHIREEFGGSLNAYKAWAKADNEGRIKVLKGGK